MPFVLTDNPENLIPRGSWEGTGTRAFLHIMAANPKIAREYMASLGNQIRDYGGGNDWKWAWRKTEKDPWVPAESQGFVDFLLDHIADVAIAAGTGGAALLSAGLAAPSGPGAIAAGAVGGGAASGLLEAGRQAAGQSLGIPNNISAPEVGVAAVGGALAEPLGATGGAVVRSIGRFTGATLRGAGRLAPEIAAKIANIEPLAASGIAGTASGNVLMDGERLTRGGRVPLIDPERAGGILRNAIRWINRVKFPEIVKADAAVEGSTVPFDLSRAMQTLTDYTIEGAGRTAKIRTNLASQASLRSDMAKLVERITNESGFSGDWAQTPGQVATLVRRTLQNEASGKGAFAGAGPSKIYGSIVKLAGGRTRAAIESGMEAVDPNFPALMKTAYQKMTVLDFFNKRLRVADQSAAGRQAAAEYVRGVYGENKIAWLNALNDLDKHFSTGLRGRLVDRAIANIRMANIGERIGNRGLGELLPRITSGGHVRSAAAVVGGGFLAGGPMGAVVGGIAASPKVILRAAGPIAAAGQAAQSAAGALARVHLGGATRVIATGSLDTASIGLLRGVISAEGGGSKRIARQEEGPRPRRRIVIGQ